MTAVRARRAARRGACALLGALVLASITVPVRAPRAESGASGSKVADAAARARGTRVMAGIERAWRAGRHLFSMDSAMTIGSFRTSRRILGFSEEKHGATRILYVVTSPTYFRGAALLIEDAADPKRTDRMWMALPGLETLGEVDAASLGLQVPGTGLTFEEARGWIAADKYGFAVVREDAQEVEILARPLTESVARALGVSTLVIHIDPRRRAVTRFEVRDLAGNLVKTYEAVEFVNVAGRWCPAHAVIDQPQQRARTVIRYRYRPLNAPLPAGLLSPPQRAGACLDRLLAWRDRMGFEAAFPDSAGQEVR